MKTLQLIILLFLTVCAAFGQTTKPCLNNFRYISKLLRENRATELAALVEYPLKRDNPLPDIKNSSEFIQQFDVLFDDQIKRKLSSVTSDDVFQRNGNCTALSGELWLNENGKIIALNYSSSAEKAQHEKLVSAIKKQMHPSVNNFERNVLVWKTGKLIARIDEVDGALRYVAWSKGKNISERPDLVLYDGIQEFQGTIGGVSYTFKNDNWTYVIDSVEACETESKCGKFIRIFSNGREEYTFRCTEVK